MLKDLLEKLEEAEKKTSEIDELWEGEPESEEIEEEWKRAYEEEFECSIDVINYICDLAKVDKKVAKAMVNGNRQALKDIAEMEG